MHHHLSALALSLLLLFVSGNGSPLSAETAQVTMRGKPVTLLGTPLEVGKPFPSISLPDISLNMVDLNSLRGKVALLSVVPSLDTPTCDKQTHILSEENAGLDQSVHLVTISRDLPFAQKRFSKEANIHNILFLSDYRDAGFGKSAGLLIEENRLLTRAVIVLDSEGLVRYIEIVPELSQLPNMKEAMSFAQKLL